MTPPKKPNLDDPVCLDITPNEIFSTCLCGAHVTDANFSSSIVGSAASEVLVAENKRTANSARFARLNFSEFSQYVVGEATPMEIEYFKEQAQNAFVQGAALVGKRVERGLIVR
jgi:hydrogenase maturation factor HypE